MARVMVVEDDSMTAFAASYHIEEMGHEVVGVSDSASGALVHAERFTPDVAVVDIVINGDTDGVVLGRKLAEDYGCRVVYMSAYSFLLESLEGRPATVRKPFKPEELRNVIDNTLMQGV